MQTRSFQVSRNWGMAISLLILAMEYSVALGTEARRTLAGTNPVQDIRAMLKNGDSLLNLHENVRADSIFSRVIEVDSLNAEAYAGRGVARTPYPEPRLARQDLDRAIKLNPNLLRAYVYRANLKSRLGLSDSAIADCNFVIKLDQANSEAFLARGRAYGSKGNNEAALLDFGVVLMIDSMNCDAMVGVAGIRQEMGDQTSALDMYQRAIDRCRSAKSWGLFIAHLRRGEIFDSRGKDSLAVASFRNALRINPHSFEAYYYLGNILLENGDSVRAREAYRSAINYPQPSDSVWVKQIYEAMPDLMNEAGKRAKVLK
jgi:tetratricopeptide (TPR) repeat protein